MNERPMCTPGMVLGVAVMVGQVVAGAAFVYLMVRFLRPSI